MGDSIRIRAAGVAGSFYPGDARQLRRDVNQLIDSVPATQPTGRPLVLIEPHAGYMYSGQVAAHGYKLLRSSPVKTAVVIGPSHMEYFPFVSVFSGDAYETPLGPVATHKPLAKQIATGDRLIKISERGHIQPQFPRKEHALEVQLPFLQCVLDDFTLVPIVMGEQNWEACVALGKKLGPVLKSGDTIIVASSDLSHFHSYDDAKKLDEAFCHALVQMDPRGLFEAVRKNNCEACGAGPIISAIIASQHATTGTCQVLFAANSGDVTGDRDNVVGYLSAVVAETETDRVDETEFEKRVEQSMHSTEQIYLLKLARYAIEKSLGLPRVVPDHPTSATLDSHRGAFVTLETKGKLRGCIGVVEPSRTLREIVPEMAEAAAFGDPRFKPIRRDELPDLAIEISVLSALDKIDGPEEINIGHHGVVVEKENERGLLLPQVATEHSWDAPAFLERTCEKAGLDRDAWKSDDVRIFTFSAIVFDEKAEFSH